LGVAVRAAPCSDDADIEAVMAAVAREAGGGVVLLGGDIFTGIHLNPIVASAAHHRVPTVGTTRTFAAEGGLMSYGGHVDDLFRRSTAS
jgi:putative ABC transport system substrate-binding protein